MKADPEWFPTWFWYQHQTDTIIGMCHFIGQQGLPALAINIDIKLLKCKNVVITKYSNFKKRAHEKLMSFHKAAASG